jgi:hypothetical protein
MYLVSKKKKKEGISGAGDGSSLACMKKALGLPPPHAAP